MMCDECGKNPAQFHLIGLTPDGQKERNLCPECMARLQQNTPDLDMGKLTEILGHFLAQTGRKAKEKNSSEDRPAEVVPDLVCEYCGTTYETTHKTGLFGCPQCVKAFSVPLEGVLLKLHGGTRHTGRTENAPDERTQLFVEMERTQAQMNVAIKTENYEEAAVLRDRLQALRAQAENGRCRT